MEGGETENQIFYPRDILYPFYLNSDEKWDRTVKELNTLAKFESFMYQLLDDNSVHPVDFFRIMRSLESDMSEYHGRNDFHLLIEVVNCLFKIISANIHLDNVKDEAVRADKKFMEQMIKEDKEIMTRAEEEKKKIAKQLEELIVEKKETEDKLNSVEKQYTAL